MRFIEAWSGHSRLWLKRTELSQHQNLPCLRLAMNPTLKEAEHNACFTALPALLSDRRIGVKYATGHSFWGEWERRAFLSLTVTLLVSLQFGS